MGEIVIACVIVCLIVWIAPELKKIAFELRRANSLKEAEMKANGIEIPSEG